MSVILLMSRLVLDDARGQVDAKLVTCPYFLNGVRKRKDWERAVDGVAFIDSTEGVSDDDANAKNLEAVDGLLPTAAGAEVLPSDNDVALFGLFSEGLKAFEASERVLSHLSKACNGQIAIMVDSVRVDVIIGDDPGVAREL